jgi:hypothetical protein
MARRIGGDLSPNLCHGPSRLIRVHWLIGGCVGCGTTTWHTSRRRGDGDGSRALIPQNKRPPPMNTEEEAYAF